jgi:ribosome-associated protein
MRIPRERLEFRFSRSGGPGGQNVNKVATKAELRFRLDEADWIPERVRARLRKLQARRINSDGDFVITSSRYRSQARNVEDCVEKLRACLVGASQQRKRRIPTTPSKGAKRRRMESKREQSERKSRRRWRPD